MIRFCAALIATVSLVFAGCGPDRDPVVYEVPKETSEAAPPIPAAGSGAAPMAQQSLPEGLAGTGETPHWQLPSGWVDSEGSSMRRGSFTVPGTGLDIAVTTFPGDVGGMLANVNRWRNQIGLEPIDENGLAAVNEDITTQAGTAVLTELDGAEASTLSVTLIHNGNSWFFKMTGPSPEVENEQARFLEFVRSVHFH